MSGFFIQGAGGRETFVRIYIYIYRVYQKTVGKFSLN